MLQTSIYPPCTASLPSLAHSKLRQKASCTTSTDLLRAIGFMGFPCLFPLFASMEDSIKEKKEKSFSAKSQPCKLWLSSDCLARLSLSLMLSAFRKVLQICHALGDTVQLHCFLIIPSTILVSPQPPNCSLKDTAATPRSPNTRNGSCTRPLTLAWPRPCW